MKTPIGVALRRAVVLVLFLTSFGCSYNPEWNTVGGTDTNLSLTSDSLPFGPVLVGTSANKPITITNNGSEPVTVVSAALSGPDFSLRGIEFPFSLEAGASKTGTVAFSPGASGETAGSLGFVSNAASRTVALSGSGVTAKPRAVTLTWQPSTAGITGHNIYRSKTSGGPYDRISPRPEPGNAYVDSSVQPGSTYYYVVTTVDHARMESAYSSQVVAVIPKR